MLESCSGSVATGSTQQNSQHMKTSSTDDVPRTFFSRSPSSTAVAGKASDQPKRTPVSQEEIEAIWCGFHWTGNLS
ncbi:hypothetical protein BC332_00241 [Capsicum chinense]|nr:hypothetical protein BC332_00241 [Capsicum chinense]